MINVSGVVIISKELSQHNFKHREYFKQREVIVTESFFGGDTIIWII